MKLVSGLLVPAAAVAVAGLMLSAAGCTESSIGDGSPVPTVSGSATASASATGRDGALQVGETVELTGVVTEGGMFAFELQPDGGGPAMPVLTLADESVDKGDRVTVEGRVVTVSASALERDLGVDLDDDAVEKLSGRQALFATSVTNHTRAPQTRTPSPTPTPTPSSSPTAPAGSSA